MEIPYGKVIMYVLTFIGYIYSGYGTGLLNNLREAVLSAENIFGDVVKNVITATNTLNGVHDIFNAAVDEHCIFKCTNEGVSPVPNRNHRPTANGCGSLGMKIEVQFLKDSDMESCCNVHDICYDTCNKDKEVCDLEFKRCLYRQCDAHHKKNDLALKGCKGAAKILWTGSMAFGCKYYIEAQSNACYCAPLARSDKRNYKYTKGSGEL